MLDRNKKAFADPNEALPYNISVVDFRKLNLNTIPDTNRMPSITMILANLARARYCTTVDLKAGYHHITLPENDRENTNFAASSLG